MEAVDLLPMLLPYLKPVFLYVVLPFCVVCTAATFVVKLLPLPKEIASQRYLIFYNIVRRAAGNAPFQIRFGANGNGNGNGNGAPKNGG